jgi:hypothetical protein
MVLSLSELLDAGRDCDAGGAAGDCDAGACGGADGGSLGFGDCA